MTIKVAPSPIPTARSFDRPMPLMVSSPLDLEPNEVPSDSLVTASSEKDVCGALKALLEDILSFYVESEKIHWHLRLHLRWNFPTTYFASETLARELCHTSLQAILLVAQMKRVFDSEYRSECMELTTVIADRISELSRLRKFGEGGSH
jgi:hypothetical protein